MGMGEVTQGESAEWEQGLGPSLDNSNIGSLGREKSTRKYEMK